MSPFGNKDEGVDSIISVSMSYCLLNYSELPHINFLWTKCLLYLYISVCELGCEFSIYNSWLPCLELIISVYSLFLCNVSVLKIIQVLFFANWNYISWFTYKSPCIVHVTNICRYLL